MHHKPTTHSPLVKVQRLIKRKGGVMLRYCISKQERPVKVYNFYIINISIKKYKGVS